MPLFSKKIDKKDEKKDGLSLNKKTVSKSTGSVDKKKNVVLGTSRLASTILRGPRVTEKAYSLSSLLNQYVFCVAPFATKQSVRCAVKELYKVAVKNVRIVTVHSRTRRFGRTMGKKSGFKKAIVTVKKGDTIDLFTGI